MRAVHRESHELLSALVTQPSRSLPSNSGPRHGRRVFEAHFHRFTRLENLGAPHRTPLFRSPAKQWTEEESYDRNSDKRRTETPEAQTETGKELPPPRRDLFAIRIYVEHLRSNQRAQSAKRSAPPPRSRPS